MPQTGCLVCAALGLCYCRRMTSDNTAANGKHDHFRIGLSSPINITALQAVITAVQTVWPEGTLGVPKKGESAALLIPKKALLDGRRIVPQDVIKALREDSQVEADSIASQTDITIMAPGAAEATPPPDILNLLSGYCHALLEALPEGSNAIQQTIHISDRAEPYVLSIQPKSQAENRSPVEWKEGTGWVRVVAKASEGDRLRRKVLQRLSSMANVNRLLGKSMRTQITEALKAD